MPDAGEARVSYQGKHRMWLVSSATLSPKRRHIPGNPYQRTAAGHQWKTITLCGLTHVRKAVITGGATELALPVCAFCTKLGNLTKRELFNG